MLGPYTITSIQYVIGPDKKNMDVKLYCVHIGQQQFSVKPCRQSQSSSNICVANKSGPIPLTDLPLKQGKYDIRSLEYDMHVYNINILYTF